MTNDSTPEELLLPTEMIAEMSSSSIMRLTTLLFIMVTLTGCSTPQVEHATYLYSDRMTELYYYNTMPQAKYKMNVSCYVEPFGTAKFTNVLSDESMLGSNVLWDLTSFGEGIQQETVRKLKETMFCYDTQSKSVDNSKFIISGRLKSIDTRIGWGFNKKHTTNAILEYNIRYE